MLLCLSVVGFPNWHVSGCHFQEQVGWGSWQFESRDLVWFFTYKCHELHLPTFVSNQTTNVRFWTISGVGHQNGQCLIFTILFRGDLPYIGNCGLNTHKKSCHIALITCHLWRPAYAPVHGKRLGNFSGLCSAEKQGHWKSSLVRKV